jgi:drug/metabolite transporter (DMT)-like permease
MSLTCWAFGISAVAGALIRPWWHFDTHLLTGQSAGVPRWLLAAYLIVFGTITPYVLTTFAMRHLPATSVGIVGMTEVVWASMFAWVLLAETLSPAQLFGGLVLVVGVAIAESARVATGDASDPNPGPPADPPEGTERSRTAGVVQAPRGDQPTVRAGR